MKYPLLSLLILPFVVACAQPPEQIRNGFSFYLPPNDTTQSKNLPNFPAANIETKGFVSTNSKGEFVVDGESIRFWGNNLVFDAAFPDKEKADIIAGRMRKMGFNLVRFHHIDNPFTEGSLFEQGKPTRQLNAESLDRLEYLIAALKKQGIYVNMNLLVSRRFHPNDGVEDADSLGYAKGSALFDPQLISLQKEYARHLLSHKNPYTGKSLVDDPVLAMVEIINENSMFRMWRNGELKPFVEGGQLTSRHSKMLDGLWHEFLRKKYGNEEALDSKWAISSNQKNNALSIKNGGFEGNIADGSWRLDAYEGAKATFSKSKEGVKGTGAEIMITQNTGTDWHVQLLQNGISIEKGKAYAIQFYAKADGDKALSISIMRDNEPYTYYSGQVFPVGKEWQKHVFTFVAPEDNEGHARVSINFQDHMGIFMIDELELQESGGTGLQEGESLENGTVSRIAFENRLQFSDNRVGDLTHFYASVQSKFINGMYSFLEKDLGLKVPMAGTNWFAGPEDVWMQADVDYLDNHAYWDHPTFPAGEWSPTEWEIRNEPMVKAADGGTLTKLFAGYQMKNKPYTISEYNHTFPNLYIAEMMPMISAYSAFHGADAIMFFDYNADDDWDTDVVNSFFSIDRNNLLMGASPLFAKAFRDGWIAEAAKPIIIRYSPEDIALTAKRADKPWIAGMPFDEKLALTHKIVIQDFDAAVTKNPAAELPDPQSPFQTTTQQISWDQDGLFQISTPQFVSFSGFLDDFPDQEAGHVHLTSADGFGSLAWAILEGSSLKEASRSLISLTSRIDNQQMGWVGQKTLRDQWGQAPTELRPLQVTLSWESDADDITIYPLDETGKKQMGRTISAVKKSKGHFEVTLDQVQYPTLWFLVEAQ